MEIDAVGLAGMNPFRPVMCAVGCGMLMGADRAGDTVLKVSNAAAAVGMLMSCVWNSLKSLLRFVSDWL